MSLFSTQHVYLQKPILDKAADYCLTPYRAFFHGKTVKWENNAPTRSVSHECSLEYEWRVQRLQTLGKIVALVPGLLAGMALKLLALATSSRFYSLYFSYKAYSATPSFTEKPFSAPPLDVRYKQKSITDMHEVCTKQFTTLAFKKDCWNDPDFITSVTSCMNLSWQKAQLLFEKLALNFGNDKEKMAMTLRDQVCQPNYCFPYFSVSITTLYHMARGRYFEDRVEGHTRGNCPVLTRDEQLCFYDPEKPQYQWRKLYNSFCDLLDQYELRERMQRKDARFVNWAIADSVGPESIQPRHTFPDTRPTPSITST